MVYAGLMNTIVGEISNSDIRDEATLLTPIFDRSMRRRKKVDQLLSPELYIDSNQFIQWLQEKLRTLYKSPSINIHLLQRWKNGKYYDRVSRTEQPLWRDIRNKTRAHNEDVYIPVGPKGSRENTIFQISWLPTHHESEVIAGMREFRERWARTLSLIQMYNHDELTGLYNKSFEKSYGVALDREWTNAHYWIVVIDLKKFKQINDTYGHTVGDEALRRFAACMQHIFQRDSERPIRHGGDEFSIVFRFGQWTASEEQQQIIENGMKRLQDYINDINDTGGFDLGKLENDAPILVRLSFRYGTALYSPWDSLRDTFASVWARADPPKSKGREGDTHVV